MGQVDPLSHPRHAFTAAATSFSIGTVCTKLMMAQSSHTIFERGVQGLLAAFQRAAHDQRCQGQGRTRPLVSTDNA